jgi:glyoxylase-like metal-dependent hydrolase (beta-lactamase superfamily II)
MHGPVEIAPGVHGLGSEFVNWYLVEEGDRLTAVDAGMPSFRKTLENDLRAIGRHTDDIAAVVLTHSDADHTGIVPELRQAGARVLIHSDDEDTLRRPRPKGGDATPRHMLPYLRHGAAWRIAAHMVRGGAARPPKVEGAETFADGAVLDVPGSPRVVHTPGHTPGHCVFRTDAKVFSGDLVFAGSIGRSDFPNSSPPDMERSLRRFLEQPDELDVYPGHGPATTVGHERRTNPFLLGLE